MCLLCQKAAGTVESSAQVSDSFGAGSDSAQAYMESGSTETAEAASIGLLGVGGATIAALALAWITLTVGLAKGTQILNKMH